MGGRLKLPGENTGTIIYTQLVSITEIQSGMTSLPIISVVCAKHNRISFRVYLFSHPSFHGETRCPKQQARP